MFLCLSFPTPNKLHHYSSPWEKRFCSPVKILFWWKQVVHERKIVWHRTEFICCLPKEAEKSSSRRRGGGAAKEQSCFPFLKTAARSKPTFILQNKTLHLASAARVVCILCWANISVNKFPNLNIYWNLQIVTHSSISSMNIACFALARVRPKERSLFLFCSFYINFI